MKKANNKNMQNRQNLQIYLFTFFLENIFKFWMSKREAEDKIGTFPIHEVKIN